MLVAAVLLTASTGAWAGAVVPPGFDSFDQTCTNGGCGWNVGSSTTPVPVGFDPAAGSWVKTLTIQNMGTPHFVDEWLQVSGTTAWTDWHEEILTPDWNWATGATATKPETWSG